MDRPSLPNSESQVVWQDRRDGTRWVARVIQSLETGWKLEVGFYEEDGAVVVRDVRLSPDGRRVPPGGITRRMLQKIAFKPALEQAQASAERLVGDSELGATELAALLQGSFLQHPGRRGHSDAYYARLAVRYQQLVDAGHRDVVKRIAQELHLESGRVANLLTRTRKKGFLTPAAPGLALGRATPAAHAALRREKALADSAPRAS